LEKKKSGHTSENKNPTTVVKNSFEAKVQESMTNKKSSTINLKQIAENNKT